MDAMEPVEQEQPENVESYTDATANPEGQDPKMKSQVDGYINILMTLVHSDKTHEKIKQMLTSSNDPFIVIPKAAMTVNDMGINLMQNKGKKPTFGVQLAASTYLITDLVELGAALGQWEAPTEQDMAGIYEDTLQAVIERGLADGSIDPIQLQIDAEGMMNEDQKRAGSGFAEAKGLGAEPSNQAIMEQHATAKVNKYKGTAAKQNAQKQKKEMALQGGPAGPQAPPQGGQA